MEQTETKTLNRRSTAGPLPSDLGASVPRRTGNQILTTRVGLRFPPELGFDQWADAGPKLLRLADSLAWCVGDWLVYGQDRYEGRYAETIERIGLDYQTLRNYVWVVRKFEISRRRETLSFQHHAEVASLPPAEQDEWLDRAEKHGWSRNQLRRQMRQGRDGRSHHGHAVSALRGLHVDQRRLEAWQLAAAHEGSELQSWILGTLDGAAAKALDA